MTSVMIRAGTARSAAHYPAAIATSTAAWATRGGGESYAGSWLIVMSGGGGAAAVAHAEPGRL
jgi:hypothetical protein